MDLIKKSEVSYISVEISIKQTNAPKQSFFAVKEGFIFKCNSITLSDMTFIFF